MRAHGEIIDPSLGQVILLRVRLDPTASEFDPFDFSCIAQVQDGVATIMGLPAVPKGTRTAINEELIRLGCTRVGGIRRRKGHPPTPFYFKLIPRTVRHEAAA